MGHGKANLREARFVGANLHGAHLEAAHLEGAYFPVADLDDAHLEGADLRGANLHGANLENAHPQGLNLHGTLYNRDPPWNIRWPAGFDPQAHGALLEERTGSPSAVLVSLRSTARS